MFSQGDAITIEEKEENLAESLGDGEETVVIMEDGVKKIGFITPSTNLTQGIVVGV